MASNIAIKGTSNAQRSTPRTCKVCRNSCLELWDSKSFYKHAANGNDLSSAARTCSFCHMIDKALGVPKRGALLESEKADAMATFLWSMAILGTKDPPGEGQIVIKPWKSDSCAMFIEVKENQSAFPIRSKLHLFVQPGTWVLHS